MLRAIVLFILPLILCVSAQYIYNSQPIQPVSYEPVQVAPPTQPLIDYPPAPLAKSAHPLKHLLPLLPKPEPDRQPVFTNHYQPTPFQGPSQIIPNHQELPCHDNVEIVTEPCPVIVETQAPPVYVPTQPPAPKYVPTLPTPTYIMYGQPPATAPPQPTVEIVNEPCPDTVQTQAPPVYIPTQPPAPKYVPTLPTPTYIMYGQPPATAPPQPTVEIVTEPCPVIVETQAPAVYVPTQPPAPKYVPTLPTPTYIMYGQPPATAPPQPTVEIVTEPCPVIVETQAPAVYVPTQPPAPKYVPTLPTPTYIMYGQPPATAPPQPTVEIVTEPCPVIVETQAPAVYVPTQPPAPKYVPTLPTPTYIMYGQPPATAPPQPTVEIVTESCPVIVETQAPSVYVPTQPPAPKYVPTLPTPTYIMYGQPPATAPPQPTVEIVTEPCPVIVETQAPPVYVPTQPLATAPVVPSNQELPCYDNASIVYVMYSQPPAIAPTQPPVEIVTEPCPVIVETQAPPVYVPTQPLATAPVVPSNQELPCYDNASIVYVMYDQPPTIAPTQPPVEIVTEPCPVIVQTQAPAVYVPTQPPVVPSNQELPCHDNASIVYVMYGQPPVSQQPAIAGSQPSVTAVPQTPVQVAPQQPLVIAPQRPTQATPVSVPSSKLNFTCPDDNGFYAIDKVCDTYIQCENRIATMQNCSDGLHFNTAAKWNEQPCGDPASVKCAAGSVERT